MILLLDNYDSFTYNIKQYLQQLETEVVVHKNDTISIAQIENLQPSAIVLGPGPGTPDDAGITLTCIKHFANKIPLLGVCLGHQAIAQAFGAKIIRAKKVMHGRISLIEHNEDGLFLEMDNPTPFTRYHSLLIDFNTLPDTLEITAWTAEEVSNQGASNDIDNKALTKINSTSNGGIEIMAIRHKYLPIAGVQFHPESILSEEGLKLFDNFLKAYHIQ